MADNSCADELALKDVESDNLINSSELFTVAVERCPLCSDSKRTFYCRNCVDSGKFVHSDATYPYSYDDRNTKWDLTLKERDHYLERVKSRLEVIQEKDIKRTTIEDCRRNIELLKLSLATTKKLINEGKTRHETTRRNNLIRYAKGKKHAEKKKRIKEYIEKVNETVDKKEQKLADRYLELMQLRQKHTSDLTAYIFDVSEVKAKGDGTGSSDHVREELQEASQTAYVRGRWVYSSGQYRIVEPTLPSHGEYSQYTIMVAKSREDGNSEAASPGHPGNSIIAGLCYTSQLTSVLSYLLHINLPKRQCYSEFCVDTMSEKQFNSAISRLNQNVLYLCFSQNVHMENLEPKHTLHNVLMMLGTKHLGRIDSFNIIQDMMDSVEDSNGTSEDSDEDHNLAYDEADGDEWERVPDNIPLAVMPQDASSMHALGYTSQDMSESTLSASGVLSSFTSFFSRR